MGALLTLVLLLAASLIRYNRWLRELKVRAEEGDNRLRMFSAQLPGAIFEYHERLDGTAHYPYVSDAVLKLYETTPLKQLPKSLGDNMLNAFRRKA